MKKLSSKMKLGAMLVLFAFLSTAGFAQQTQKQQTPAKMQSERKLTREEHVKMMNDKVTALEKNLVSLKAEAIAKKKDASADYKTLLADVEGKVAALKTRLGAFKETAQDKVDAFENETHAAWNAIRKEYDKLHAQAYQDVKKPATGKEASKN